MGPASFFAYLLCVSVLRIRISSVDNLDEEIYIATNGWGICAVPGYEDGQPPGLGWRQILGK